MHQEFKDMSQQDLEKNASIHLYSVGATTALLSVQVSLSDRHLVQNTTASLRPVKYITYWLPVGQIIDFFFKSILTSQVFREKQHSVFMHVSNTQKT